MHLRNILESHRKITKKREQTFDVQIFFSFGKGALADGSGEFVELVKFFVHVNGGSSELLDFFGALSKDEGEGWVRRWWRRAG